MIDQLRNSYQYQRNSAPSIKKRCAKGTDSGCIPSLYHFP